MEQTTEYRFSSDDAQEVYGVDAQTAGGELDRIRRRDGTIHPAVVVDEARPEEAPLHPAFEWRDAVAAERYRQHQATELIKVVRVVTPPPAPRTAPTVIRPQQGSERPMVVEQHDPFESQLREVVGQMVEAERRLEQIQVLARRQFNRQRMIRLQVALDTLREAHEALVSAEQEANWAMDPALAMAKG